jgi:hypothetical protein
MAATGVLGLSPVILYAVVRRRYKFRWGSAAAYIGPFVLLAVSFGAVTLIFMSLLPGYSNGGGGGY